MPMYADWLQPHVSSTHTHVDVKTAKENILPKLYARMRRARKENKNTLTRQDVSELKQGF